jgi:hypothetical protein
LLSNNIASAICAGNPSAANFRWVTKLLKY